MLKLEGFDHSTDDSRRLAADCIRPADADPKGGRLWPTCCKTPSAAIRYPVVAAMAKLGLTKANAQHSAIAAGQRYLWLHRRMVSNSMECTGRSWKLFKPPTGSGLIRRPHCTCVSREANG